MVLVNFTKAFDPTRITLESAVTLKFELKLSSFLADRRQDYVVNGS